MKNMITVYSLAFSQYDAGFAVYESHWTFDIFGADDLQNYCAENVHWDVHDEKFYKVKNRFVESVNWKLDEKLGMFMLCLIKRKSLFK